MTCDVYFNPAFPLRLENLENGKAFSSQGKVREVWTDWKSQEKSHKILKTQEILEKYYLLFLVIFKWTVYYLLKWVKFSVWKNKTLKNYWKSENHVIVIQEYFWFWKVSLRHFIHFCSQIFTFIFTAQKQSLGQGNIFTGICPLGEGVCGRHPPQADTPPPGRHIPLGRPPPPRDGHWSGRYASYWNTFLCYFSID